MTSRKPLGRVIRVNDVPRVNTVSDESALIKNPYDRNDVLNRIEIEKSRFVTAIASFDLLASE